MRAFYDAEECVCKIWVISIFQIFSEIILKFWKIVYNTILEKFFFSYLKTKNIYTKFQNDLAEYFEI